MKPSESRPGLSQLGLAEAEPEASKKRGRNVAETWPKRGRNVAETWPKSLENRRKEALLFGSKSSRLNSRPQLPKSSFVPWPGGPDAGNPWRSHGKAFDRHVAE